MICMGYRRRCLINIMLRVWGGDGGWLTEKRQQLGRLLTEITFLFTIFSLFHTSVSLRNIGVLLLFFSMKYLRLSCDNLLQKNCNKTVVTKQWTEHQPNGREVQKSSRTWNGKCFVTCCVCVCGLTLWLLLLVYSLNSNFDRVRSKAVEETQIWGKTASALSTTTTTTMTTTYDPSIYHHCISRTVAVYSFDGLVFVKIEWKTILYCTRMKMEQQSSQICWMNVG